LLNDFLSSINKRRRPATFNVLVYALQTAEKTIGKPLDIITYEELQRYIDFIKIERKLADSTIELMQRKFIQPQERDRCFIAVMFETKTVS
jgi:hypothetical protein